MKKLSVFVTLVILAFVISAAVYREGNLPVDRNSQEYKIFLIPPGEGLSSIARRLAADGLIRNRLVFYLIVKRAGIEKNIQAGEFRLSPRMTGTQIAQTLTHGTTDVWVTILEGWRKEEAAQAISAKLNIPESEIIKRAAEGYLFPDTYLFPRNATIATVLSILRLNFQKKYSSAVADKIKRLGLSQDQAITLASLVEREARSDTVRQQVASIIYKRYKNDWFLNIDATVQYALGYQIQEKSWWKKQLSAADLTVNSSYNTYKYIGLPPGPICSPSLSAITAVANIDPNTPYWYYLTDANGHVHYAVTLEEHNANIDNYLR
ncbi:endolytic transglycosylase MltG [Patescibacteria group bacterium]|nr:endolytic transglycosylase MltG [Patescibacteria group bacterium]MCL5091757.1 endolytic transglycosylase MltG [Patescibacteria group bacterium]